MRCVPRKSRHQWVFFLLVVCLLGVYLAYTKLLESEKQPILRNFGPDDDRIEQLQQQLKERVHNDLKMPQPPSQLNNYHSNNKLVDIHNTIVVQKYVLPDFHAGRVLENEVDYVTSDEKFARVKLLLLTLSPTNWKTTLDPDEMILLAKSELLDLGMNSKLSCREIDNMKTEYGQQQGFYGKKKIDYVRQGLTKDYVLKSVGRDTQLKIDCLKMDYRQDRCQLMGNYRLVKELVLFNILQHPSIIKIEGFCLRGETIDPRVRMKGAIIVTESGKQIQHDMFQLLPWSAKVDLGSQLMKLLIYLENSPIGSLGFDKLQIQDFVMLKSDIKLVDLDNLVMGETVCSHAEDCKIEEMPSKVIQCINKVCKGRNSQRNLYLLHQSLLVMLLKYSPESRSEEVRQFQENVQELRFTPREVLSWFHKEGNSGSRLVPDMRIDQSKFDNRIDSQDRASKKRAENNLPGNDGEFNQHEGSDNANKGTYDRQGNANFPGRYDYKCELSRVTWGCVLTVKGLDEAKSLCDKDDLCASFVVFSSNPENDAMMTMVKKNGVDGNPEANYGATLFKKNNSRKEKAILRINDAANGVQEPSDKLEYKPTKTDKVTVKACYSKMLEVTSIARSRREKRLLTHLGLRGITEDEWKVYAQSQAMVKYIGASQLSSATVKGGRFKFQFDTNAVDLQKGEFISEMGPKYYHVSYLASYHLDRILGLYHIPPTVSRTMSKHDLDHMLGDKLAKFRNITGENGLQGIVSVPMPPVMRTSALTIEKRDSRVATVPLFNRNQKVQVEYILLWALTRMIQPQHGYLGYKGHLIHFEADLAFSGLQRSLVGYFYNCQFPNTVYKALICFKCQDSKKLSQVCGLGFEVIRRLKNSGLSATDIHVGTVSNEDMIDIINSSASEILKVVDQCIRTFNRETVLY